MGERKPAPGARRLWLLLLFAVAVRDLTAPERATVALEQYGGTVIETSLSGEDAKTLQDALRSLSTGSGS
jgi:uncharacterized membrane protein